jgi:hypothetical protein
MIQQPNQPTFQDCDNSSGTSSNSLVQCGLLFHALEDKFITTILLLLRVIAVIATIATSITTWIVATMLIIAMLLIAVLFIAMLDHTHASQNSCRACHHAHHDIRHSHNGLHASLH